MPFGYLVEKIKAAKFETTPFKHLEITDFLSPAHFAEIVASKYVSMGEAKDTGGLLEQLEERGYRVIHFPGCVVVKKTYLDWVEGRSRRSISETTEGFGMVMRLTECESSLVQDLQDFLISAEFQHCLAEKFEIERPVTIDAGVQKYLHGYEISPHPDIRRKALTWMLNLNPGAEPEAQDYHTHYLSFRPEWAFVAEFWRHNLDCDRCWVPWDWCDTIKMQRRNNSIVIFSPSNDTMHGVKASYDHLKTQRTQFYGNLWYENQKLTELKFHHLDPRNGRGMRDKVAEGAIGHLMKAGRKLGRGGFVNIRSV